MKSLITQCVNMKFLSEDMEKTALLEVFFLSIQFIIISINCLIIYKIIFYNNDNNILLIINKN